MAMQKEITTDSGVTLNYHKFKGFENEGKARVKRDHKVCELDQKETSLLKRIIYTALRREETYKEATEVFEEDNYNMIDYLEWVSTEDLQAELDKRSNE